jgi:hypothetical protein
LSLRTEYLDDQQDPSGFSLKDRRIRQMRLTSNASLPKIEIFPDVMISDQLIEVLFGVVTTLRRWIVVIGGR